MILQYPRAGHSVKEKIRVQDCELFEKKYYIVIFFAMCKNEIIPIFPHEWTIHWEAIPRLNINFSNQKGDNYT